MMSEMDELRSLAIGTYNVAVKSFLRGETLRILLEAAGVFSHEQFEQKLVEARQRWDSARENDPRIPGDPLEQIRLLERLFGDA